MNYSALYENKKRGTFDFPIELYYVNDASTRYQMPLHWHLEYELILVRSGSFQLSLDGQSFDLKSGDCAWIGDGVIHGGIPTDCVYECLVVDLSALLHDAPMCKRNATEFLADKSGHTGIFAHSSAQALLADQIFTAMECEYSGYEWVTIGLLWQFMGMLIGQGIRPQLTLKNRKQILRLKNVLTYIRDNYENEVTLDELAMIAGMAPRYFCRAFSAMTGKTPVAYLNYYRVEQAGEHLLLTDDSITDIAVHCGFNDLSYFSKVFAKQKGMTPSAYRRSRSVE